LGDLEELAKVALADGGTPISPDAIDKRLERLQGEIARVQSSTRIEALLQGVLVEPHGGTAAPTTVDEGLAAAAGAGSARFAERAELVVAAQARQLSSSATSLALELWR
jgi:hypothetical protein